MNKIFSNNSVVAIVAIATFALIGGILGFSNAAVAECGPTCGEVPLTCSPQSQVGAIGDVLNFTAEGGNGTFSWSAVGGNPSAGSNQNFSTSYSTAGSKTVTVSSGSQIKTCNVTIGCGQSCGGGDNPPVDPPAENVSCSPANQNVNIGQLARFSATGGDGSYSWSASGGSPSNGNNSNFSTRYSTSGSKTVVVSSAGKISTCHVNVNQPPVPTLSCNPQNQSVLVNGTANFSATGGTGIYSWSANGGSPANGSGANFSTSYSNAGSKTVTVTSGSQTANCNVAVSEPPVSTLSCNPQDQSVLVNGTANFSATGGTGSYSWSASGGSPITGNGSNFSTSYSTAGNKTVTVTSGNQTATCNVAVNEIPQQTLTCNPQNQSVFVNNSANFSATGGTGTYSWSGGESPSTGSGASFSTQFNSVGFRTVVVTSGNQTATCNVTINQQQQNNLTCGPQNQSANVNDVVNFYANGGNGNYSWTAYDAQITYGNNQNFSTRFNSAGSKTVTVNSNGQTATCYVNVNTVFGSNTYFQITKNVLNKTLNQNSYVNFVEAQSNDLLEFEIRIRNTGNTNAEVNLKDILPSDLNYVYGSATMNGYYLNDSVINYNGVSLGNVYPGEEKTIHLRVTVRPNAPAVTITNQAVATMNSNTQNAFATIQLKNRGQVLGAADIVTGPEDVMPWVLSLGFITSLVVYFYFFYSRPMQRRVSLAEVSVADIVSVTSDEETGVFKAVRPKKELDALISELKKAETAPDV
jgi:uncharacterized repeat protein (TIGR01451 family)